MLSNLLHTALSLRGQTWAGQTWAVVQPAFRTIGGLFRIPVLPTK